MVLKDLEVVVLCAGGGTRLGSITKKIPKPMIPICGKPFLEYILNFYKNKCITQFVIPVGYLGNQIKDYFGDGSKFGVQIKYVESSVEVETGGSFKRAGPFINGDIFFMQWGDIFFPLDLEKMYNTFVNSDKEAMIVVSKRDKILDYQDKNDLLLDNDGNVILYDLNNTSGKCTHLHCGLLLFKKTIFDLCVNDCFKLEIDLFLPLIAKKSLLGFLVSSTPFDIGNSDKIKETELRIKEFSNSCL